MFGILQKQNSNKKDSKNTEQTQQDTSYDNLTLPNFLLRLNLKYGKIERIPKNIPNEEIVFNVSSRIVVRKKHAIAVKRNRLRRRLKSAIDIEFCKAISSDMLYKSNNNIINAKQENKYLNCYQGDINDFLSKINIGCIIFTESESYLSTFKEISFFAKNLKKHLLDTVRKEINTMLS
ncbi:MAG: hypothetical protein JJW01_03690 [Alphaproteobacteria bacterium]|nr:hypothetical protein [Rickettsiales bacterium]